MAYSVLSDDVLLRYNARGRHTRAVVGEQGPAGPPGATGPAGPRGAPGICVTLNSLSAHNSNSDDVKLRLSGTALKLPCHEVSDGFSANAADTVFTVEEKGVYFISYQINLGADYALKSEVTRNGKPIDGLMMLAASPRDVYASQTITPLDEGDKLSVVLYASSCTVEFQKGTGAFLNVIRLV